MNLHKLIKEEYTKIQLENFLYSYMMKNLNEYQDDFIIDEAISGKQFYDSIVSKGHKKDEIFEVIIPIELLKNKYKKKARQIDLKTTVPIDTTILDKFILEFKEAKEKNVELYEKYSKWANWYHDFNKLLHSSMKNKNDVNLFLAAVAFTSANTALDTNIIEAAKLFSAVKSDWNKSNATRRALGFIANNINTIDSQKEVTSLMKLSRSNSSYSNLLVPKRDITSADLKQVKEITISQSKLKNYNNFVKYFIENRGKITKEKLMSDLQAGVLEIGGTKIYSFFINLIDPDYEWINIEGDENAKIQPATIDIWMFKLFFTNPLKELVDELQNEEIIVDTDASKNIFIQSAIRLLSSSDKVRANIVKILNEKIKEHGLDMKANQLQAFGWVKFREEAGVPSAKFSSFSDVVEFTRKISDRINELNPELNFIQKYGKNIKSQFSYVLSTIELLSKMPRVNLKNEKEINRVISNWREFEPEYTLDKGAAKSGTTLKSGGSSSKEKYILNPREVEPGVWESGVKFKKENLATIRSNSRNDVIRKAKKWINDNRPFDVSK